MSSIRIQRQHQLGRDQARALLGELAKALEQRLSARCQWQGDELHFERTGASGCVRVGDDQLDVEVKLGTLLRPLRDSIATQITEELDERLGHAS